MPTNPSEDTVPDYFISYTSTDRKWAEWIAWQIEEMGHKTVLQAWDFKAGENFVLKMQEATTQAKKTIAILSPDYLAAEYTGSEWATAFACDPTGKKGKLIPIKVRPVDTEALGLFKTIIRIDLTGLTTDEELKRCLFEKIKASEDGIRNKPIAEPPSPISIFNSSESNKKQTQKSENTQSEASLASKKKLEDSPEFIVGLVDKIEQANQIFKWTDDNFFINDEKAASPLAFLLYGAASQWPDALTYILYYEIKKQLKFYSLVPLQEDSPDSVCLDGRIYREDISPEKHLRELVAEKLNCPPIDESICNILATKKVPNIFFRRLLSEESENPELVLGMLQAWEKLKYSNHSPRHLLILFYEQADKPVSIWLRWFKKNQSLIDKINKALPTHIREKLLLPKIKSPNKKLIEDWVDGHFHHAVTQDVKDFVAAEIRQEFDQRKKTKNGGKEHLQRILISKDDFEIHHHDLKRILIKALMQFGQQNI